MTIPRLALLLIRRSPFRALMLAALIAVCSVVFSLVSELSRVSQEGLDSAIVKDNGLVGSYEVTLGDLSVPMGDQYEIVAEAANSLGMSLWRYAEVLPEVQSECPPYEQVGEQSLQVLWIRPGVAAPLAFGQVDGIDTEWCIDGQSIPKDSLFVASEEEQSVYGVQLYIEPAYRDLVALSSTEPITYRFIIVSGKDIDQTESVRAAVVVALEPLAASMGYDTAAVTAGRLDQDGAGVREAAEGIAFVYDLIRWGVLALAGLALLTVQMLSARQRGWFYGLLTALGAGHRRVIRLVALDTVLIAAGGLLLAVVVLGAASGSVASFAEHAFNVEAEGLSVSTMVPLSCGIAGVAALAAIGPALMIIRRDPLAVLEAPRD